MDDVLLDPGFLQTLERLSLISRKVFLGRTKGEKRSARRGSGMEFADYRSYSPGDDLRSVDWNTYARSDRLFVKLYTEEEDLQCHILLDGSKSMDFGSPSKWDYARQLATAIGYVSLCGLDRVDIFRFSETLQDSIGPLRGRPQVFKILQFLSNLHPEGTTNFSKSIGDFSNRSSGNGLIFVLSDFLSPKPEERLTPLISPRFQVCVIQILDETEINPQYVGDLKLIDCETSHAKEVSVTQDLLARYRKSMQGHSRRLQEFCVKHGMDFIQTTTQTPMEDLVLKSLRRIRMVG